jgi:hypothetical protein
MFHYKLRTLMILLAVGPPCLALAWLHPEPVLTIGVPMSFSSMIIIPVIAGVRRAELLRRRRERRRRRSG